jgi:hypothetical protein
MKSCGEHTGKADGPPSSASILHKLREIGPPCVDVFARLTFLLRTGGRRRGAGRLCHVDRERHGALWRSSEGGIKDFLVIPDRFWVFDTEFIAEADVQTKVPALVTAQTKWTCLHVMFSPKPRMRSKKRGAVKLAPDNDTSMTSQYNKRCNT